MLGYSSGLRLPSGGFLFKWASLTNTEWLKAAHLLLFKQVHLIRTSPCRDLCLWKKPLQDRYRCLDICVIWSGSPCRIDTGVCEKNTPFLSALPCNPAAETTLLAPNPRSENLEIWDFDPSMCSCLRYGISRARIWTFVYALFVHAFGGDSRRLPLATVKQPEGIADVFGDVESPQKLRRRSQNPGSWNSPPQT